MTKKKNYFKIKKFLIFFAFFISIFSNSKAADLFYELNAKKIIYKNNQDIVIAEGDAVANNDSGKTISADRIVYNKISKIIKTFGKSKYHDDKNILTADNFEYDLKLNSIYAYGNVKYYDQEKNIYSFKELKLFKEKELLIGRGIYIKFKDNSSLIADKGEYNQITKRLKLTNGTYTTCLNTTNMKNEYCPAWSLSSKEIIHDKNKKNIYYKNSFFKFKNVPAFYSPYFSHPDPTVKRQSGFLFPTLTSLTDIGQTIQVPYFWAIAEDKDLTVTPVYYKQEHNLYLSSYRQIFKNGFLQIENGYSKGYKDTSKNSRTPGSRNFFFLNYNQNLPNFFDSSELKVKIQRVSQENFLKVNKINTTLFKEDMSNLENTIKFSTFSNRNNFSISSSVLENLNDTTNTKYTYIYPEVNLGHNNKFGNFYYNINSNFKNSKFLHNQKQSKLLNEINVTSDQFIYKKIGFGTYLKSNLINNSFYNDNVSNEKNNLNIDGNYTIALDNTLPFAKFSHNQKQFIQPRLFVKYTTGKMKNINDQEKILEFSDIFSLNRANSNETPETGLSFGQGVEYIFKRRNKISSFTNEFGIGQVFRTTRLDNMPSMSSLNNKTSDIVGKWALNFSKNKNKEELSNVISNQDKTNSISVNYNFNLDNDFSKIYRNDINLSGNYNDNKYSITFEEKNHHIGNARLIDFTYSKRFKTNFYFSYGIRKNLLTDLLENKSYGINYENDCLKISLLGIEDFYENKDLKSSKKISLGFTIKPFSYDFSPDLAGLFK